MKLSTRLHLAPRLRMSRALLPPICLHGVDRDSFTFTIFICVIESTANAFMPSLTKVTLSETLIRFLNCTGPFRSRDINYLSFFNVTRINGLCSRLDVSCATFDLSAVD